MFNSGVNSTLNKTVKVEWYFTNIFSVLKVPLKIKMLLPYSPQPNRENGIKFLFFCPFNILHDQMSETCYPFRSDNMQ